MHMNEKWLKKAVTYRRGGGQIFGHRYASGRRSFMYRVYIIQWGLPYYPGGVPRHDLSDFGPK